ncbi:hypothetical protein GDO86_012384 [Hymenochirus boettgeri]|uniref:Uncharacterized protein n=1 Tax=Hymenochirus boettgeri TaxID=247094 RepID=A0A8T2IPU8_9PIPI|nr:hypothetical protein GDO86_012384 [Hymenochirus boettgeri]
MATAMAPLFLLVLTICLFSTGFGENKDCNYKGKIFKDGETITIDCQICECSNGNEECSVDANCKKKKNNNADKKPDPIIYDDPLVIDASNKLLLSRVKRALKMPENFLQHNDRGGKGKDHDEHRGSKENKGDHDSKEKTGGNIGLGFGTGHDHDSKEMTGGHGLGKGHDHDSKEMNGGKSGLGFDREHDDHKGSHERKEQDHDSKEMTGM